MKYSPDQPTGFPLPADEAVDDDVQLRQTVIPTSVDELRAGVPDQSRAEVSEREASLLRRLADRKLVDQLAREDFTGALYEAFTTELTRYGLSVMRAWIRSGHISALLRARGAGGGLTETERALMLRDHALLDDLAYMTVAQALHNFEKIALRQGRWRSDGGAKLTTYFMGACIYAFAGEVKRMRRELAHRSKDLLGDGVAFDLDEMPDSDDPERSAVIHDLAGTAMARLKPKEREIVALIANGYEYTEIAEVLGGSARSVEGAVYRMRQRLGRDAHEEGAGHVVR